MLKRNFHLDPPTPKNCSITANWHRVSGWYADPSGKPARAVRIRIGKRIITCRKIARTDVVAKTKINSVEDTQVGFAADFRTGCGPKLFVFEILEDDGQWVAVEKRLVLAREQSRLPGSNEGEKSFHSDFAAAEGLNRLDHLYQSCLGVKIQYSEEQCDTTWVIPDFRGGGGGHLNIFRMIKNFEKLGAPKQQILIVGLHSKKSREHAYGELEKYFFELDAEVYLQTDIIPTSKKFVATCWQTAYFVREQKGEKFYFIQDYEPMFYAAGSNSMLAANTYTFGFRVITAGFWLQKILKRDYNADAVSYAFSYDKDLYAPRDNASDQFEYDIFFYARPHTERRMFDLGMAAIESAIKLSKRKIRVAFAGASIAPESAPFKFKNLGALPLRDLPDLYRSTKCGLVLSATNASLLPYELMASGCAVVTNEGENNEWLFTDGYPGVAPNTPDELGAKIHELLENEAFREKLVEKGLQIVSKTSWIEGARTVLDFMQNEKV